MEWSRYQRDVFDEVAHGKGSLIVEAVAGSGKTTTIVEAINHVPDIEDVCFLAFNKSIAAELGRRITPGRAVCKTLHAMGFAAWKRHCASDGPMAVESRKTSDIIDDILDYRETNKLGQSFRRLVALAKNSGIAPASLPMPVSLHPDEDESWEHLIELYELDVEQENLRLIIDCARKVLVESIKRADTVIDFDDMLYMPVISGASFDKFDVVFVDEAQDVSGIQLEMIDRMRAINTRIIAVGDPYQAIYGFRGALFDSMSKMERRFDCKRLPLSVCYRCGKGIVAEARAIVPHIEHHEKAIEGSVNGAFLSDTLIKEFQASDAVLCRVTKPLIALAFTCIRARVPCKVLGRDIGKGLVTIVNKLRAKDTSDLLGKLTIYREREVTRLKGDESKVAALDDKLDTIREFINALPLNAGIPSLIAEIESLFADEQGRYLTLATVHKAKGLEWDRVFILDADRYMPPRWLKKPGQQEDNLKYVAITRARKELIWLGSGESF